MPSGFQAEFKQLALQPCKKLFRYTLNVAPSSSLAEPVQLSNWNTFNAMLFNCSWDTFNATPFDNLLKPMQPLFSQDNLNPLNAAPSNSPTEVQLFH